MDIAIISDYFTSATDSSVGFADRGWRTSVAIGQDSQASIEAGVFAIDTDSRTVEGNIAAARVQSLVSFISDARVIVKQFDSTLRGHMARECIAALQASSRAKLLVAAA